MTGDDIKNARRLLGDMWGVGRPLTLAELARALRLRGGKPGEAVRKWENGSTEISGPASACIDMMLKGAMPADDLTEILKST